MTKEVYFNAKQLEFLQAQQKRCALIWGRGTGKGVALAGRNYLRMLNLPRAKTFLSSTTYGQLLTKTLPPMLEKWAEIGLSENVHYVIGKKPLKGWDQPYKPPKKFQNVISFQNGFAIELASMDRPDTLRGGSYDGGDVDEAAFVDGTYFRRVMIPSIRGNKNKFSHYLHQNLNIVTSMPRDPRGEWSLEYKQRAAAKPDLYYYSEATALDNVDILGEETLQLWEDEMDYLEFQVEVMNRRMNVATDAFYHRFRAERHTYVPAYDYTDGERGIEVCGMKDYDARALLDITFDFGGWFSCAIVFQEDQRTERAIRTFHVKEASITDLVDKICQGFADHAMKMVRIWGEPRGTDRSAYGATAFEQVEERFKRNGWRTQLRVQSAYTRKHAERHTWVNEILEEVNMALPKVRISEMHCKALIIALQLAEVGPDFTKNKSKEKDRTYPQEHATHYTDALDYYLVQKYSFLMAGQGRRGSGFFRFS
jgi:hypothetical protein